MVEISHEGCSESNLGAFNRKHKQVGFYGVPAVKREIVSALYACTILRVYKCTNLGGTAEIYPSSLYI